MKNNNLLKITIDIFMTFFLIFSLMYSFTGKNIHKSIGILFFISVISHIFINKNNLKTSFKKKYKFSKKFCDTINFLILIMTVIITISGIILSFYSDRNIAPNFFYFFRITHIIATHFMLFFVIIHVLFYYKNITRLLKNIRKAN